MSKYVPWCEQVSNSRGHWTVGANAGLEVHRWTDEDVELENKRYICKQHVSKVKLWADLKG